MSTIDKKSEKDRQTRDDSPSGNPLNKDALNLPNLITVSRFVLAIVLFTLIYIQGYWITSAIVFIVAAWTDFLDGWLARKYNQVTALGRILDPFVDKIIVSGAFIFLLNKEAIYNGGDPLTSGVNAWMVIIIIGREMFVTSLRGFLEKEGKDFSASLSGKIKMIIQCVAVPASLLSLSADVVGKFDWVPFVRDILLWSAVAITLYSGLIYIFRAVKLLSEND